MDFMEEALKEAYEGIENNHGGPFGCVIVKDGKIIGRGHNRVLLNKDPTCHGEMEPCPMCKGGILWANIRKVFYGCTVQDTDKIGFRDDDFYAAFNGNSDTLCIKETDRQRCLELFSAYEAKNPQRY